ncbi:RdgB/HAM1 family non-canonical purine NTP pyrophosphatase [Kamptonema cortianum]|nr:RdgB/HAM1 family non-canonical purine NTP pyrophosphatase [Geitlerinema splendidum]MDK3160391.1 RdgB/HAM1 family non-canonical purine NTP pyrophosphatase [Kamptonema cortianum]
MSLPDRIVIATHNAKKAKEMVTILSASFPAIEFSTLEEFPEAPEPEETGETYQENAAIKAESACKFTGLWSLADDAGLEIDALPGELGVHSKRFAGEDTSFKEKMRLILLWMSGIPEEKRTARFQCTIALARPGEETVFFDATCEGRIAEKPSGKGGFGYDPIFWLEEKGCTMADLTADQKHEISHRGKVLREFSKWLAKQ